ncbi:phage tail tube protein [Sphingomonas hengshuiensis]|uniref:Phage tail protein n=1 Tax=Sphingomonas hengshuiensis TaxID=1609977 RepID=A0A7U4LGD0_9SPHN|nr:phage tail tube protein [Sphingomonas hengshuiensis]AJP73168.1 hypothetical protein TS85_17285 [Sphingomonas hengshuiensis]
MASKNQVAGKAKVRVNGGAIETMGDTTLELGGVKREPMPGDYNAGNFKEGAPAPAKLTIKIPAKSSFSPTAWAAIVGATVLVEFDTGKAFTFKEAYSEGAPNATTSDGSYEGVLYGQPAEEIA